MINHPFLYSARASRPKPGPNGWWKDSVNTALLHSAWIARLIKMADEQGLILSDPYFGHVCSVAITLYLYWARASNPRISGPAEDNLKICKSAIARLATHWPICKTMVFCLLEIAATLADCLTGRRRREPDLTRLALATACRRIFHGCLDAHSVDVESPALRLTPKRKPRPEHIRGFIPRSTENQSQ